jgi:pilus assembly protein Flp/PilA
MGDSGKVFVAPGQEFTGYMKQANRFGKNGRPVCSGRARDLGTGGVANRDMRTTGDASPGVHPGPFLTQEFPMKMVTKNLVNFLKKEDGPTAVEYAVMLALIIVVCIAAITALGSNANNTFSYVASKTQPTTTAS